MLLIRQSYKGSFLRTDRDHLILFTVCSWVAGMATDDQLIRQMTLGSASAWRPRVVRDCQHCGHEPAVSMDERPDDGPVPSFGQRMRCGRCGKFGATAVPNWIERADRLPGGPEMMSSRRTP
jgi:hypothetical protein